MHDAHGRSPAGPLLRTAAWAVHLLTASGALWGLLALDEALSKLADERPDHARVVEMRFFGGLTGKETAEVMDVSERTVERQWRFARAWLYRELTDGPESPSSV